METCFAYCFAQMPAVATPAKLRCLQKNTFRRNKKRDCTRGCNLCIGRYVIASYWGLASCRRVPCPTVAVLSKSFTMARRGAAVALPAGVMVRS